MALLSAAQSVTGLTFKELLWDVPVSFLYQAEIIYAARLGMVCVKHGKPSVDPAYIKRWELLMGRKWQDEGFN